jgi:hypothetical protein
MGSKRIPSMADPLKCDGCRVVFELEDPHNIDASFKALGAAGWLSLARRGVGRERWTWKCSACKPRGSAEFGLSTGSMTKKGP